MGNAPLLLLSTIPARSLAGRVASHLHTSLLPDTELWFACGEGKLVVEANVRGADVYVFQQPIGPGDDHSVYDRFVMLLHAVEACALADAERVTAVLPYLPGARQDKRKGRTREGIGAGLFARCLEAAGVRRVLTVEVHNPAVAGMFHPAQCTLENLQVVARMAPWLRERGLCGDVVAAPDVGGLERARLFAEELGAGLVAVSKERDYRVPNHIARSTLIGDVAGRDVLLVDDIIDTAGSVISAVDALKAGGARHVTIACAHPLLSHPAFDRLDSLAARAQTEGWRLRVVGTSSVEHGAVRPWYESFDLAPLLASAIRSMHGRGSVTAVQGG